MSVLVVRVGADDVDAASDWLFQFGATAIEERGEHEHTELVAGFVDDDVALAARSLLQERWACRLEDTGDEAAWRDAWLHHVEPLPIGPFLVHAPWHDITDLTTAGAADPATGIDCTTTGDAALARVPISIDPGRAFGSGHHPTTQLAIELMTELVQPSDRVLDVGCGTGILSIVAASLGAAAVLGVDLDYDILAVAQANVDANDAGRVVELTATPLHQITSAAGERCESWDLVVANIVIGDLRPVLPQVLGATQRAAVVTGFLDDQLDSLLISSGVDIDRVELRSRDGWSAAALRPRPTSTGGLA